MGFILALTLSSMLALGTKAPDFRLPSAENGFYYFLNQLKGVKGTVIMFICNHCPYVKHIISEVSELAEHYQNKEINFIAISSNDVKEYPEDSFEHMREFAKEHKFSFHYLYDESQEIAKAYQAACTPDFYVFDKDLLLVYRGRFDSSSPGNEILPTGEDIKKALTALITADTISDEQKPSMGCNIKWKN